jgi:HK97 family phage prohead protease
MERRYLPLALAGVTVEERVGSDTPWIVGYAAVYFREADPGTEYSIFEDLHERIMPGAFDRILREGRDCRGLFNHDPDNLLGRVAAGTMRLGVDTTGLKYEINMPDTMCARDVVTSIKRGDLSGSSFSFTAMDVTWREQGQVTIREIRDCDVYDVGPVTFPAYTGSTVHIRAADAQAVKQQLAVWKGAQRKIAFWAQARARVVELEVGLDEHD